VNKTILVNLAKCTGCDMCVDVCSAQKRGFYSEKSSEIRIDKDESGAVFVPLICEQCREHSCVDICPVHAIRYDDTLSIFKVDEKTCTGCQVCEEACPYRGIFVSEGVAIKCDLCGGNPLCPKVCYPGALQYLEVTEGVILADLECKMAKLKKLRGGAHE
jgi:anaerobic carbon-monoxide dehydrogenase iron sulfur subunit